MFCKHRFSFQLLPGMRQPPPYKMGDLPWMRQVAEGVVITLVVPDCDDTVVLTERQS